MTPNSAVPSYAGDRRNPACISRNQSKPGGGLALGRLRPRHRNGVPKVALQGISLSYRANDGTQLVALDNIDLKVSPGEFLCVVGPSGCGKSTLLHLIAGLHPPSTGSVEVDGQPVKGPGTDRILIFQELGLFPWLTVEQNVEFGMKMKGIPKPERQERVAHYLRLVHLARFEHSYCHQLSGGMRQRVALARAAGLRTGCLVDG